MSLNEIQRPARRLIRELHALDIEPPEPIAAVVARTASVTTGLADLRQAGTQLPDLIRRAADGEKVAPTRALLGASVTGQVADKIDADLADELVVAIRKHATEVIDVLRPTFEEANAAMTAATGVLGDLDLDDLAAVTAKGGTAADAWQKAKAAEEQVRAILKVIGTLIAMRAISVRSSDQREHRLFICDPTYEQYVACVGAQTTPWQCHRACGGLDLATPTSYAERVARMDRGWAEDPRNPANRGVAGNNIGQVPSAIVL